MKSIEKTGRTVAEAVSAALKELGVDSDEAEVHVLEEGRRGFLGLGGREARVRVTVRRDPRKAAVEFMERVLGAMGLSGRAAARTEDGQLMVQIEGQELAVLIGHHGRTLDAMEYLLGLVVSRQCGNRVRVILDVEGYRERRKEAIERMAARAAQKVRRTGKPAVLEPMSARERKLVHLALQSEPDLCTRSEGEEPFRKIVIAKK